MLTKTIRRVAAGSNARRARFADALAVAARASACALLVGIFFGRTASAEDTGCQAVRDSAVKQITTPTHVYITLTPRGGTPKLSESIYTGGMIYVLIHDTWSSHPLSPGDMLQQLEATAKKAKKTCRHLRDESVNGEAAAVYSARSEGEDGKSDSLIWISASRGLPLKSEVDMAVGKNGTNHMSLRYDYGNVQPPAGVK
jgi:hypothetical protein